MFVYALDRDGRTYSDDDLAHIKPSNLIWTKTAIAQSQGMSLENAKQAANHFLDRMSIPRMFQPKRAKPWQRPPTCMR